MRTITLITLLPLAGCFAHQAKPAIRDHADQQRSIVELCEAEAFASPCPADLMPILRESSKQADLIAEIHGVK